MDSENVEKELEDLIGLLRCLNKIEDRDRKRWLKSEIRRLINLMMRD